MQTDKKKEWVEVRVGAGLETLVGWMAVETRPGLRLSSYVRRMTFPYPVNQLSYESPQTGLFVSLAVAPIGDKDVFDAGRVPLEDLLRLPQFVETIL